MHPRAGLPPSARRRAGMRARLPLAHTPEVRPSPAHHGRRGATVSRRARDRSPSPWVLAAGRYVDLALFDVLPVQARQARFDSEERVEVADSLSDERFRVSL